MCLSEQACPNQGYYRSFCGVTFFNYTRYQHKLQHISNQKSHIMIIHQLQRIIL